MGEFSIDVMCLDGSRERWNVSLADDEGAGIVLSDGSSLEWRSVGEDFFEALTDIRLRVEPLGYSLLCNGARVDAYPSGFSREASRGRSLYLLQIGRAARKQVDIFAYAAPSSVGTVMEQRSFYESWLAAPKRRRLADWIFDAMKEMWVRWRDR
ncbi:hypothetical protein [Kitasatospora sp. DSM 101779]|uniref:hypothetical protein n=1 Tax=Kitasatospora sp. DSM 101779 TaxID=2853165 RepID=UPI0021D9B0B1|nr:hypothetical protein [Kitasatospora sp. DSM 101779]MCU7823133.1 hypothetical protein [Kitasatospora sp. DSM 101779]